VVKKLAVAKLLLDFGFQPNFQNVTEIDNSWLRWFVYTWFFPLTRVTFENFECLLSVAGKVVTVGLSCLTIHED